MTDVNVQLAHLVVASFRNSHVLLIIIYAQIPGFYLLSKTRTRTHTHTKRTRFIRLLHSEADYPLGFASQAN